MTEGTSGNDPVISPNPQDSPVNTEHRLRTVISSSRYMSFFLRALEEKIGERTPFLTKAYGDREHFQKITADALSAGAAYIKAENLEPPKKFAWQKTARKAYQDVYNNFRKSTLFGSEILDDATQIAGEDIIITETGNSELMVDVSEREVFLPEALQKLKKDPGKIRVSKQGVIKMATELKTVYDQLGLSLPLEQTFHAAVYRTVLHEIGHAIHIALTGRGRATMEEAKKLGIQFPPVPFPNMVHPQIHLEHFAEGIVHAEFMDGPHGIPADLFSQWNRIHLQDAQAARALFEFGSRKKIYVGELADHTLELASLYDPLPLPRPDYLIAYYDEPYSVEQLKQFSTF